MEFKNNNATKNNRISGCISSTNSNIKLGSVVLELDYETAWALCNVLTKEMIVEHPYLDRCQHEPLIKLGEAIGMYCGHSNANFITEALDK